MVAACERSGRNPREVQLVAVSKVRPARDVNAVVEAGQLLFGENRVQEAREKIPQVAGSGLKWHLIGPLQRNKVKYAVALFDLIQSVDSLELAREIHQKTQRPMPVLIQVNIGREPQKHGLLPEEVEGLAREMAQLSGLQVRGLMAIPPYAPDPEAVRPYFQAITQLADHLAGLGIPEISMAERSMGMSHDYEVAIEEGATLVRVGSALFGPRPPR
ncbi:MAG: YggS family pyridoxal phosphate-dependent enzyme [Magnetococcales bacterium]|nr:YggS family pyridoxal phosphate-dependent enzyme [Magnetococcales bacterium]